jgi:hypothetical protein
MIAAPFVFAPSGKTEVRVGETTLRTLLCLAGVSGFEGPYKEMALVSAGAGIAAALGV